MPAVPVWWPDVSVDYVEGTTLSNKWARVKEAEARIQEMIRKGISPVRERCELIKYLSFFNESQSLSPSARWTLRVEIAVLYEKLGDYKRSVREYAEIVNENPRDLALYALAIQYGRLGERESALQIYNYMAKNFEDDSIGAEIAMWGIACLNGVTNDCTLAKPAWWSQYQSSPDWWADVPVALPNISCFEDGFEFVVHTIRKEQDPRKLVKAWLLLSEFAPITFNEKLRVLSSASRAYSEIEDHHRAIEWAWKIPEQFPSAVADTTNALRFIASEFEKLNELDHAQEIRDSLPCFAKERSSE